LGEEALTANLLLANEGLETLTQTGLVARVLGKRGHHLRVTGDEGRVDASLLDELSNQSIQHTGIGQGWCALHIHLLANALEELVGLLGVELVTRGELLASGLFQSGDHLHAAPGGLPVDVIGFASLGVVGGLVSTSDLLDQARDKLLGQIHHIEHIGVGPVEFTGGELRVVSKIDTLVTELTANLVNTLETTDNEHLEVQLRGNTKVLLLVKVVVFELVSVRLAGKSCKI
jgi:hypothetical protein